MLVKLKTLTGGDSQVMKKVPDLIPSFCKRLVILVVKLIDHGFHKECHPVRYVIGNHGRYAGQEHVRYAVHRPFLSEDIQESHLRVGFV